MGIQHHLRVRGPGSLLQGEDDHSITGLAAQSIAKCLDLSICVDVVDRKPLLCSQWHLRRLHLRLWPGASRRL